MPKKPKPREKIWTVCVHIHGTELRIKDFRKLKEAKDVRIKIISGDETIE